MNRNLSRLVTATAACLILASCASVGGASTTITSTSLAPVLPPVVTSAVEPSTPPLPFGPVTTPAAPPAAEPDSSVATSPVAPPSTTGSRPWFVALRSDGVLEAWAARGKQVEVPTCASYGGDHGCAILDAAVSDTSLWFVELGRDGSALKRVALTGGDPVTVLRARGLDESFRDIAVSADDSTAWVVRRPAGDAASELLRVRSDATTVEATGVTGVALSTDGRRLAIARSGVGAGTLGPTTLVVRDLATGADRELPFINAGGPPYALVDLAWSYDDRRLSFATAWEGRTVRVLDLETASTVEEAIVPEVPVAMPGGGGPTAVQQSCWTGSTLALGAWRYPYADEPPTSGDVVGYDVGRRSVRPAGVSVFAQGYGNGMACRDDGAVALVDAFPPDVPEWSATGDLVVIRADGRTTRLGRDYQRVFAA